MKNQLAILVATVVVLVLLAYMFVFVVRYDQVAVVTTFDKARPEVRNDAGEIVEAGSLIREPGLYAKWPWPVQKVRSYTSRLQVLDDQPQEDLTADGKSVIVDLYLAWRIDDPLAFFKNIKTMARAEEELQPLLSDAHSVIGQFRFDQMVNADAEQLRLDEIEAEMTRLLNDRLTQQGFGIRVERVGIRRLMLSEKITEKVFERMKKTRERMAANARQSGRAQAEAIRSEAESIQQRILAFTERRALAIRSEGDREAAQYYEVFSQEPRFAIFLRQIEALPEILKKNATLVLPAEGNAPLDLLVNEPGARPGATASRP
jgi:membrane protease subunit HflC